VDAGRETIPEPLASSTISQSLAAIELQSWATAHLQILPEAASGAIGEREE